MKYVGLWMLSGVLFACAGGASDGGDSAGPQQLDDALVTASDAESAHQGDGGTADAVPMDALTAPDIGGAPDAAPEPDVEAALDVEAVPDTASPPLDVGPAPEEDVTPDPEEPALLGGGILLFELASELLDRAGAGARFIDATPSEEPESSHGACVVTTGDPDAPSPPPDYGYDAGEITVSGTSPALTLTSVDEGSAGTGYDAGLSEELESLLPVGGALLTVSGSGGAEIDAFTMFLQVPEPVTLSAPSTGLFQGVSASSDLTVSWNAGNGDLCLVTLSPLSATFQPVAGKGLVCTVSGDPGALTIPAAALSELKSAGVSKVALGVTRLKSDEVVAGEWRVPAAISRSTGGPLGLD